MLITDLCDDILELIGEEVKKHPRYMMRGVFKEIGPLPGRNNGRWWRLLSSPYRPDISILPTRRGNHCIIEEGLMSEWAMYYRKHYEMCLYECSRGRWHKGS